MQKALSQDGGEVSIRAKFNLVDLAGTPVDEPPSLCSCLGVVGIGPCAVQKR